eukprot:TRINITY_DN4085_c0_g3_i1.p1 TRINITY_DN4085_c0_g3~~TRINITY_DN4085_c0_g3_i1.p1  ORF type:complete len:279 (-),score=43.43 TRINITY_DN4085_c0_g3_i1:1-837(-)
MLAATNSSLAVREAQAECKQSAAEDWRKRAVRRFTERIADLSDEAVEQLKSVLHEQAGKNNVSSKQVLLHCYDSLRAPYLVYVPNGGWLCLEISCDIDQTAETDLSTATPPERCWTLSSFCETDCGEIEHYKLQGEQQILPVLQQLTQKGQAVDISEYPRVTVVSARHTYTIRINEEGSAVVRHKPTSVNVCIEHSLIKNDYYGTIVTVSATNSKVLALALAQLGFAQQLPQRPLVSGRRRRARQKKKKEMIHRHPTPPGWLHYRWGEWWGYVGRNTS